MDRKHNNTNTNKKTHHNRQKQKRRNNGKRRAKSNDVPDEATNCGNNDMDDIMAQLQLQRQRQKQKKKDDNDAAIIDERNGEQNNSKKRSADSSSRKQDIGDFRFDPKSNRYLPKSCFNKPDKEATHPKERENVCIDRLRWEKRSTISDEDWRRVVFRGSAINSSNKLPTDRSKKKKSKKQHISNPQQQIPCSERIVQLLTTSLQYASPRKRSTIVNLLGPISIVRGARITPSAVSEDMLLSDTTTRRFSQHNLTSDMHRRTNLETRASNQVASDHQQAPIQTHQSDNTASLTFSKQPHSNTLDHPRWYSLLHPIMKTESNIAMPYDCVCKTYLPPTASTFDIMSYPKSLPAVITNTDKKLFYREKCPISKHGRKAFQSDVDNPIDDAWEFNLGDGMSCQSIKFSSIDNIVGSLQRDSSLNYQLVLNNVDPNARTAPIFQRDLEGQVNDFCFPPSTRNTVAFVCGAESRFGVGYINLVSETCVQYYKHHSSEILSAHLLDNNHVMSCGHRDGYISLHDARGGKASCCKNLRDVGSITSTHPLQDGNSIIVKGSFGPCWVADIRKFGDSSASPSNDAVLTNLDIPVSLLHKTNSTRCTGVASNPEETIAVSPFACQDKISFAVWCLQTGKFLRCVDVPEADSNTQLPKFCELSSKTTSGFEMSQRKGSATAARIVEESNFGVWFKSGSISNPAPPNCGGIHHLSFPK